MSISSTLESTKPDFPAGKAIRPAAQVDSPFALSLRSKGYLCIALLLGYLSLCTLLLVLHRDQFLAYLDDYRSLQAASEVLTRAQSALFDAATALAGGPENSLSGLPDPHPERLRQRYREIAALLPGEAVTLAGLVQSPGSTGPGRPSGFERNLQLRITDARTEIEQLGLIKQGQLKALIEAHNLRDEQLIFWSLSAAFLGSILIAFLAGVFFRGLEANLQRLCGRVDGIVDRYHGKSRHEKCKDLPDRLTRSIDDLARLLGEREQALEAGRREELFRERLVAVDSLAGGIAHEIGNPITCIAGLATEIAADPQTRLGDRGRSMLGLLRHHADKIIGISHDLAHLDTRIPEQRELIDVNQMLAASTNLCRYDSRWAEIDIDVHLDPRVPALFVSAMQINLITMLLLDNAREALHGRSDARLEVRTELDPGDNTLIVFRDNRARGSNSELQKFFEPGFSCQEPCEECGLGLTICAVVTHSGCGRIRARSTEPDGLQVELLFPVETPPAEGEPRA